MNPNDKKFVIVGLVICVIIAVLAPFIASPNPDGLEKSDEQVGMAEESGIYESPFPDYIIPAFGENPFSGIVALILGVLITLGLGYGVAELLKRRNPPESSE